ncbi:hypothetical protein F5Y04DRAFT_12095 [Hypomontagnella monticulosa]|nr:hypothetical protein F5Y04DRAFT_12095 [Hypomontagnella monticulosa]
MFRITHAQCPSISGSCTGDPLVRNAKILQVVATTARTHPIGLDRCFLSPVPCPVSSATRRATAHPGPIYSDSDEIDHFHFPTNCYTVVTGCRLQAVYPSPVLFDGTYDFYDFLDVFPHRQCISARALVSSDWSTKSPEFFLLLTKYGRSRSSGACKIRIAN